MNFLPGAKQFAMRFLNDRGYALVRTGRTYVDAETTVAAARSQGLSVCDYRESNEDNLRKKGRRDRIIEKMNRSGLLQGLTSVCEIGAGTGMYLEKIVGLAHPAQYEVYETDAGWMRFLRAEYGHCTGTRLICHPADGQTLKSTADASCDLVHAHAVFVYLPLLQIVQYLKECVRICRPGGSVVFDCFLDSTFSSMSVADAWLASPLHFPVVIPEKLLREFCATHAINWVESFAEVYGAGTCDYLVWRK